MFSLSVRDHLMIAHSFRGAVFGPAQRLHGATYVVDAEVRTARLDGHNLVVDIGLLTRALGEALEPMRYRNLDELPEFTGQNTTTEFLARAVWQRLADRLRAFAEGSHIAKPATLKITLAESHVAWAAFEQEL
jgi:6-pyruvoyl-tetrahydropterin synthase